MGLHRLGGKKNAVEGWGGKVGWSTECGVVVVSSVWRVLIHMGTGASKREYVAEEIWKELMKWVCMSNHAWTNMCIWMGIIPVCAYVWAQYISLRLLTQMCGIMDFCGLVPLSDVSRRRQLLTSAEDLLETTKVSVCLSLSLSTDRDSVCCWCLCVTSLVNHAG